MHLLKLRHPVSNSCVGRLQASMTYKQFCFFSLCLLEALPRLIAILVSVSGMCWKVSMNRSTRERN
jgi:hypothetical protein